MTVPGSLLVNLTALPVHLQVEWMADHREADVWNLASDAAHRTFQALFPAKGTA